MKQLCLPAALVFVALAFAGCTQGDGTSQAADAPLSPRQLRVGQPLLGEYLRVAINASGHHITYDFDGRNLQQNVEPLNDHDYVERRIAAVTGRDRYWAEFPAIQYQQRLTDLDPEEGQTAVYSQQTTYRQADRYTQYDDVQTAFTLTTTSCGPSGCTTERQTEDIDYRYYHRNAAPVDALTLAGRVLTLGRTTSVNYTWTDAQGLIHAAWANYTAKKEVQVNGERAFLVEPKFETRILNAPAQPSVGATSAPAGPLPTEKESKLPKPVREMYVSARLSTPVKQVFKTPFEHEGRVYWTNVTYEVETYEAGSGIVPWGSETRHNASRLGAIPFPELQTHLNMKGLKYPFGSAWKNLRADPTLLEFQRISAKPGVVPMQATYFPDASRNAYTWALTLADEAGNGVYAQTRLQGVGTSGVFVAQDRESAGPRRGSQPLTAEILGGRTFANAEDVFGTFRAVRPGAWEPAIAFNFQQYAQSEFMVANIVFADPANARPIFASNALSGSEYLRGRDTVTFSAFDGGIDSINMTWMTILNEWPMRAPFGTPVPPQQHQVLEDARLVALLDRPWA